MRLFKGEKSDDSISEDKGENSNGAREEAAPLPQTTTATASLSPGRVRGGCQRQGQGRAAGNEVARASQANTPEAWKQTLQNVTAAWGMKTIQP